MTDRQAFGGSPEQTVNRLLKKIEEAARAGVRWIQIREKDLTARELTALVSEALRRVPATCRILVNDRLDIACAVGAGGVHLGESSIPVADAKRFVKERGLPQDFVIGASVHSLRAAKEAKQAGADYLVFGPVFATPSKVSYGEPQGIERLGEVCRSISLPVLAIGGITPENTRVCLNAGAAGIAGIRLFQDAEDMGQLADTLRVAVREAQK